MTRSDVRSTGIASRAPLRSALAAGLICLGLWGSARAQQVEDLSGSIEKYRAVLQLAAQKLADLDLPEALARYSEVIDAFTSGRLPASAPVTRQIVGQAYEGRARTYANLGKAAEAEADFEALIKFDYSWPIDRATTSPKIVAIYDKARARLVGIISVQSDPPGARVLLDGAMVGRTPLHAMEAPVGSHTLMVEADGFQSSVKETFVLAGGVRLDRSLKLRPSARGLIVTTVPSDVGVLVDGQPRGRSFGQGTPEYADAAARLGVPLNAMSAPLLLERLGPGRHTIRFERECHEPTEVAVDVVVDAEGTNAPLRLEPIPLTQSLATLEVKGPARAQVFIDGKAAGVAPVVLSGQCAGKRRVAVKLAGAGQWLSDVELRSGATTSISPQMRLTLAFLGVTKPAATGAEAPAGERELATALQSLTSYNVLVPGAGIPEEVLARGSGGADPLSRERIAETVAATGAEILIDASPAEGAFEQKLAVRIRSVRFGLVESFEVSAGSPQETQALLKRLASRVPLSAPWLGLELIEVERSPNPVVFSAVAGGPAAGAGVKPGDTLVAVAGAAVAQPADAAKATAALREGSQVSLSVQSPGAAPRQVNVKVASVPVMLGGRESGLSAPALAEQMAFRARADAPAPGQAGVERASALLTLADLLMRSGQHEAALAAALNNLQLADGPGLSLGTVEFLKGSCQLSLGRKAEAAEAMKRAAGSKDSRLWRQDGPPVAERAERVLATIR